MKNAAKKKVATIPENVASPSDANGTAAAESPASLEQRVRRLEDVVADLQDTRQLEERVAEKVGQRISLPSIQLPHPARESSTILVEASRRLLPAAVELTRGSGPRQPATTGDAGKTAVELRVPWLLLEFVSDMRGIWRLIIDPHYRLTWPARVVLLGVIPFVLTSAFWNPLGTIPFVGTVLDKAVDVLLVFFAYRILMRELALYRQAIADLPVRYRSAV